MIEPSFGIGRILYCMFEHTYYARPDDAQVPTVLLMAVALLLPFKAKSNLTLIFILTLTPLYGPDPQPHHAVDEHLENCLPDAAHHASSADMQCIDPQRTVFAFTPISAPYKATVFPLLQRVELDAPATAIAARLRAAGLSTKIDTTSACRCIPSDTGCNHVLPTSLGSVCSAFPVRA